MAKKRLLLNFPPKITDNPITCQFIREYDIIVNILQAKIFPGEEGQLILELKNESESDLKNAINYLKNKGVKVTVLKESISLDKDSCINCGACTGICKTEALSLDKNTWELEVNQEKCLLCEMCISVCPVGALALDY